MDGCEKLEAVLWCEGTLRCELWSTDSGKEVRLYDADVLTYREPVRWSTGGLRQAVELLAKAQAAIHSSG